jgi:hypothetical protein
MKGKKYRLAKRTWLIYGWPYYKQIGRIMITEYVHAYEGIRREEKRRNDVNACMHT